MGTEKAVKMKVNAANNKGEQGREEGRAMVASVSMRRKEGSGKDCADGRYADVIEDNVIRKQEKKDTYLIGPQPRAARNEPFGR
jgi:hypothetical protein